MSKRGKKYIEAKKKVDATKAYDIAEAAKLIKELSYTKFDGTLDVAVRLNVNPRHADQKVRGAVVLPHGTGKSVRVLVVARGDKAREAEEAGADFVGAEDVIEKITEGWLDFDTCIATPDMMGLLGRIGRILAPRGLMPNPRTGTVTLDISHAVSEAKAGKVDFRVEKAGIIHSGVGKVSFSEEAIVANVRAIYERLLRLKPSSVKGAYVKSVYLSATMAPGINIDISSLGAI